MNWVKISLFALTGFMVYQLLKGGETETKKRVKKGGMNKSGGGDA